MSGKKLKIWNGRGLGEYINEHFYVAAYTGKQAIELINSVIGWGMNANELRNYYNKGSWGNTMEGIEPTEPCLYVSLNNGKKVKRLI